MPGKEVFLAPLMTLLPLCKRERKTMGAIGTWTSNQTFSYGLGSAIEPLLLMSPRAAMETQGAEASSWD